MDGISHQDHGGGLARARQLDEQDPLARFRDEFHLPRDGRGEPLLYLSGNSLGLQPKRTAALVQAELEKWQHSAVRGHFEGDYPWMPYHEFLTEPMADLVGARPTEVVMMNSLTANLHFMLATFYKPTQKRHGLVIEYHSFPSDYHALESQIRWHDLDPDQSLVTLRPQYGSHEFMMSDIEQLLEDHGDEISVMVLPGVQYYTGQVFPMAEITRLAQRRGIIVGFDLAHAVGNVELQLHEWNVDFAVWCSYKYLNSGPGSVGGCFVHERHATNRELHRLAGWWGHEKETRFQMENEFRPIPTAEGWQVSNPPILSLAAIRGSLEVFGEAGGMVALTNKSRQLTGFLLSCLESVGKDRIRVITPADRGCQLSLEVTDVPGEGQQVHRKLQQAGVEADWREPNVIRVAPVPLYNTFEDVWRFSQILVECL